MAGTRTRKQTLAWGLVASCLVGMSLAGCSPKRVLNTGAPPAVRQTPASPAKGLPPDKVRAMPPGPADLDLPEPEYRGAAGTSSPAAAGTASSGGTAPPGRAGSRLGLEAAALAKKQLGKPYQWGAAGPDKFDCSGLVMYVYKNLGVKLPRVSGQQAYAGVHVDREDLEPGDLVFFKLNGSRIDHVGIYTGHSKFIHAPRKYVPVSTESLNNSYWRQRFKGGRRLE